MDVLVLVNPRAGNNRGAHWLSALKKRLEDHDGPFSARVMATRMGGIQDQLLDRAGREDRIIVVGGDGTVSAVVNALSVLKCQIPIGVVPLGTGNDLARSLGLHRGRPWSIEEALAYMQSPKIKPVDIWSLKEDMTFNNYLSLGLDARVVREFSLVRRWIQAHPFCGKRGVYFSIYILVWLRNSAGRVPCGSKLTWMDMHGVERHLQLRAPRVLALSNTPYYAAGAMMDPDAEVGDGLLEVTLFPHMREYTEMMAMRIPALAQLGVQSRWWRIRARSLQIRLSKPTCIQADGEDITDALGNSDIVSVTRLGQLPVLLRKDV